MPAHLTIKMIRAATAQQPDKTFLLEGFPRTLDALGLFEKTFGACQRALVFDPSDIATPEGQALRRQLRAYRGQTFPVVSALERRGLVRKVNPSSSDADALFIAACKAYSDS